MDVEIIHWNHATYQDFFGQSIRYPFAAFDIPSGMVEGMLQDIADNNGIPLIGIDGISPYADAASLRRFQENFLSIPENSLLIAGDIVSLYAGNTNVNGEDQRRDNNLLIATYSTGLAISSYGAYKLWNMPDTEEEVKVNLKMSRRTFLQILGVGTAALVFGTQIQHFMSAIEQFNANNGTIIDGDLEPKVVLRNLKLLGVHQILEPLYANSTVNNVDVWGTAHYSDDNRNLTNDLFQALPYDRNNFLNQVVSAKVEEMRNVYSSIEPDPIKAHEALTTFTKNFLYEIFTFRLHRKSNGDFHEINLHGHLQTVPSVDGSINYGLLNSFWGITDVARYVNSILSNIV